MMIPPPTPVPSVSSTRLWILLAGARPKLAVSGRVRVVGERDRHAEVVAHPIADRKVPPAGQVAGAQDHALGDVHRARRRDAGAGDVARCDLIVLHQAANDLGHSHAGVFGALVLLGGHRLVRERLARVIDDANLDVGAADIEADEERLLGGGHSNGGFRGRHGLMIRFQRSKQSLLSESHTEYKGGYWTRQS